MSTLRSRLGMLLAAAILLLVAIQAVPYGRAHTNPPVGREPAWDAPFTRDLARRACFDCHSNETVWPLYSHIAPMAWLVQWDVDAGRAALNFSEWQRPQEEASETAKVVNDGEMPPVAYRLIHAQARLSAEDRAALARGLDATIRASSGRRSEHRSSD
jgi:hypothetical protein